MKLKYKLSLINLSLLSFYASANLEDSLHYDGDYCAEAQRIIANTDIKPINIIHVNETSFLDSSPAPYKGVNLSAYHGKGTADSLPLTTQQIVTNDGNSEVISCKMKSAEAIRFFFGYSSAYLGGACKDIIIQTVDFVFESLDENEQTELQYDDIIVEEDIVVHSGSEWSTPFPPNVSFWDENGLLHLQAKSLPVPMDTLAPLSEDKKGVHYCHLPSANYIRSLIN